MRNIDTKFASTGVTPDEVLEQASSHSITLSEEDMEKIADFLLLDEDLSAARCEAINRALEHLG